MGIDNRRLVAVKAGSSEGMGRAVPVALDSRLRGNDGEGKSQDTVPIRHPREGGDPGNGAGPVPRDSAVFPQFTLAKAGKTA